MQVSVYTLRPKNMPQNYRTLTNKFEVIKLYFCKIIQVGPGNLLI